MSSFVVSDSDWSLPNWSQRRKQVLENTNIRAAAPFIEKQVLLKEGDKVHPTLLEAVIPSLEQDIGTLNRYIIPTQTIEKPSLELLKEGAFNIIVGETLAKTLGVEVGDSVTLLSPKQQNYSFANDANNQEAEDLLPIIREFNVVATFKVDLQVYDKSFAYIHMSDAATIFDMGENVTGLRAQVNDIFDATKITEELAEQSTGDYVISDWTKQHSSFFRALQLQKTMLFLVLLLIIGVAAFNLISTLVMVVTDKESDIAILRTLGMPPAQVMKVFVIQGSLLALIGTIIGVILGLLIANNVSALVQSLEQLFNFQALNPEIHGLTQIDAKIEVFDIILIAVSAFLLSIAATLFPAWKASKVQPAEALRYE